jgi:hypothetical protein
VRASNNKLHARVLPEAGMPRQPDARLIHPQMIGA